MVWRKPHRRGAFRDGRVLAAGASTGVLIGLALPFISILGRSASLYSLARSARHLGVLDSPVPLIAVALVLLAPLLVGLLICLTCRRSRWLQRVGAAAAILVGLIGVAFGSVGFLYSSTPRLGHVVLCSCGSIATFCGAWIASGRQAFEPPTSGKAVSETISVILGGAFVLGGTMFAYDFGKSSGPQTPTKAAELMYDGIERRDPFRILEALQPVERKILLDSGQDLVRQLQRLNIVGSDGRTTIEPRRKRGKRTYREALVPTQPGGPLRDEGSLSRVMNVEVTSGNIDSAFTTANVGPGKGLVSILFGTGLVRPPAPSKNHTVAQPTLTTVQIGNAWYVSLSHTYADGARRQATQRQADRGQRWQSRAVGNGGESSPEAAARAFLNATAEFDTLAVLAASDPEETAVGYLYVNLVLDDLSRRAKGARSQVAVTFPELSLVTSRDNDTATVRVKRWSALAVLYADDVDDSTVRLDRDCVTVTVGGVETIRCGRQVPLVVSDLYGVKAQEWTPDQARWLTEPQRLPGIVTVRRNGKWFVSPARTAIDAMAYWLKGLKPSDLQGKGNSLSERIGAFVDAASTVIG